MNLHKGFSLVEVLVSLLLLSTISVALVEHQLQTKNLVYQIEYRVNGSQFLDQFDESQSISSAYIPKITSPYHAALIYAEHRSILKLDWFQDKGLITRSYLEIGF